MRIRRSRHSGSGWRGHVTADQDGAVKRSRHSRSDQHAAQDEDSASMSQRINPAQRSPHTALSYCSG
eukprot:3879737-Rhodomonas_salina.2